MDYLWTGTTNQHLIRSPWSIITTRQHGYILIPCSMLDICQMATRSFGLLMRHMICRSYCKHAEHWYLSFCQAGGVWRMVGVLNDEHLLTGGWRQRSKSIPFVYASPLPSRPIMRSANHRYMTEHATISWSNVPRAFARDRLKHGTPLESLKILLGNLCVQI